MSRTPALTSIRRALGMLAAIVVTLASTVHGNDADVRKFFPQSSAKASVSAPIIVAQGRCYNGRCY